MDWIGLLTTHVVAHVVLCVRPARTAKTLPSRFLSFELARSPSPFGARVVVWLVGSSCVVVESQQAANSGAVGESRDAREGKTKRGTGERLIRAQFSRIVFFATFTLDCRRC